MKGEDKWRIQRPIAIPREDERVDRGEHGKVGITDYAQQTLGDIVFVDLPKPGSK